MMKFRALIWSLGVVVGLSAFAVLATACGSSGVDEPEPTPTHTPVPTHTAVSTPSAEGLRHLLSETGIGCNKIGQTGGWFPSVSRAEQTLSTDERGSGVVSKDSVKCLSPGIVDSDRPFFVTIVQYAFTSPLEASSFLADVVRESPGTPSTLPTSIGAESAAFVVPSDSFFQQASSSYENSLVALVAQGNLVVEVTTPGEEASTSGFAVEVLTSWLQNVEEAKLAPAFRPER